jgi:hypothetical protein
MSKLGSSYAAYARVSICAACGAGFIPPAHGNCCSQRCVEYIAIARAPVLGDKLYCQRDEPIRCWGCAVSFRSSGLRYCPDCWDRSRSTEAATPAAPRPVRTYGPDSDRVPGTRCLW